MTVTARPTTWPTGAVAAAVLALALAADAVATGLFVRTTGLLTILVMIVVTTPLWLLAVASLARWSPSPRLAALPVLGGGLVLGLVGITRVPRTSDDAYRYAWDARVQLAGVDPYRYVPAAPQLAHLRSAPTFGPPCTYPVPGGCTSINRPEFHTIYPPVAQAYFDVVRLATGGGHGGLLGYQLAAVLGSLLIALVVLRRCPTRPWLAGIWAWCPVVVIEYANAAHVDWLAALLSLLALSPALDRPGGAGWRRVAAGALAGAAVIVKLYPALIVPSLLRRRPWPVIAGVAGVVVLGYLPHVVAVGGGVIGYFPDYLQEENYSSGKRLLLLGYVLPHPFDTAIGLLVVLAVAIWAWRRGPVGAPADSAVIVVGAAFLVFTPTYPWYGALLLALVAVTGALEWLPLVIAPEVLYLARDISGGIIFGVAALLVAAIAWLHHRIAGPTPLPSRGQT